MLPATATSSRELRATWLEPSARLEGLAPIDHLFNRLDGLYPHRWRSAFGSEQAIANWRQAWADGFAEEGLTLDEIRIGLAACRRMFDWPPSFAEFVKACRPAMDYERAFIEAQEQMRLREDGRDEWSSPAVFWAASSMSWELRCSAYGAVKTRWRAALDKAVADVKAGKLPAEVPAKREALPAPGQSTVTQEDGRKRIEQAMAALGRKMTTEACDAA